MPILPNQLVVAVDFDDTIASGFHKDALTLLPHCKEVLSRLYGKGFRFILWTCRSDDTLEQAKEFLKEQDMFHLFDAINDQHPEARERYDFTYSPKVWADVYIDDRHIGYHVEWLLIEQHLLLELEAVQTLPV
ncbi:hypothetical protein ACFYKX_11125 [Cytobacillus sp. FJAT-54145]|uniref:Hydrolase n=1 Tax=Cytobacillus spartinae TaxID=3299023 RepID=A0ABW6KAC4_9BACI